MWSEEYEKLSPYEKGEFSRLGNYLLSRSFIIQDNYDTRQKASLPNHDYRLASRFYLLLREYFDVIGWEVVKDENYGFIAIRSIHDHNRLHFDTFTTLFLYTLRLIYEEGREQVNQFRNVRTDTQSVIEKMSALGLLVGGKMPPIKDRIGTQKTLSHHNIIQKLETSWLNDGNQLIINASILAIIPSDGIYSMMAEIEEFSEISAKTVDQEYNLDDLSNESEDELFENS